MTTGPHHFLTSPEKTGNWPDAKPQTNGSWHWLTRLGGSPEPALDSLNRALVAGLLLEVMLENPHLAEESGAQGRRLKACLRTTLASQLAGRIPLASFQSLAQGLDHWFEVVYPLLADAGLTGHHPPPVRMSPAGAVRPLREDLFRKCLEKSPDLLPRRRHRKLNPEKLRDFLERTGGAWFRLRDFEEHFQVDRKTAWEYAQKLLQAGLLIHNQGQSSAVRYRVAPGFLKPTWPPATKASGPTDPGKHDRPAWRAPSPSFFSFK